MFSNPGKIDNAAEEGIVTEVDTERKLCKVRTMSGQKLNGVQWLQPSGGSGRGGDRVTPFFGDRVIIYSGLGYPLILGFLPKLQSSENSFPLSISGGEKIVDTGNFSDGGNNTIGDQSSPKDMLSGDRVLSSPGGGMISLLRAGSVLLRSSRLSEIYLSKWDDLVRIVCRNWEQFTDVSSDIIKNIRGRVYRYTGYANESKDAKIENYKYHQYIGDVALAEAVKTNYQDNSSNPSSTDVIYKEQITTGGGSPSERLKREIHLDGTHELVVINGVFTKIKQTNEQVDITYNDTNIIIINNEMIHLSKGGDPVLTLDSSGIKAIFGGAEVTLHNSGVDTTFGGHFVKVTAGGVFLG